MGKKLFWFLMVMLLVSSVSCVRRDTGEILDHPAVSLLKSDANVALLEPAWSPGGDLLAAMGIETCLTGRCNFGLYILDIQTGELHPPIDVDGQGGIVWTPTPRVLSFVHNGINTLDLSTGKQTFVVNGGRHAWSPNGRYLAVRRQERKTGPNSPWILSLSVLNLETGQEVRVFEPPEDAQEISFTGLAWSPDSDQLTFSVSWWEPDTGYTSGLYLSNFDGSGLRRVSDEGWDPGWIPDKEWLYFLIDNEQLAFAPLDFSCLITPLDVTGIGSATISPSADQIAFEHQANVYLLDLDYLLGPDKEVLTCP